MNKINRLEILNYSINRRLMQDFSVIIVTMCVRF